MLDQFSTSNGMSDMQFDYIDLGTVASCSESVLICSLSIKTSGQSKLKS